MYKKITLAAAALAVALTMQAAFAADEACPEPRGPARFHHDRRPGKGFGRGHFGKGPGMFGFGHRVMDELELSDAQKTQVVDVLTAKFREGLLARMEMADARKQLRDASEAESPDAAAIVAANEAMGAARGKMEALGLTAKDDLRKILTPEQAAKLDEMRQSWRADRDDDDDDAPRPHRRPGPRHGRPGPGPRMGGCW